MISAHVGGRKLNFPSPRLALGMLSPSLWPLNLRVLGLKPWPARVREKDGTVRTITKPRDAWIYYSRGRLRAVGDGDIEVRFNGRSAVLKGGAVTGDLRGVFIDEEYRDLPVDGRPVLDAGAAGGDTAVYFLLRGASHVYSFEAEERTFEYLTQTISAPQFAGKVTAFRTLVTDLNPMLRELNLRDASLKIDIEGSERDVFRVADRELWRRSIQYMSIEYHFEPQTVTEHLRRLGYGYRTIWGPRPDATCLVYGGIHAWRLDEER